MDYDDIELWTPRRRRLLGAVAGAALALFAAAFALHLVGRARVDEARRELARHAPLDPAAHAPPVARDEENALLALVAAARRLPAPFEHLEALREARERRPAEWSAEDRATVAGHLAEHAEARRALRRAAALPGGGLGLDYARPDPHAGRPPWHLVGAIRLVELDGHAAVVRGDVETALAATEDLGRLATLLHAEPDVALQLLALAAGGAQLRVAREALGAGAPPAALGRMQVSVAGAAERPALARTIRREAAMLLAGDVAARARRVGRAGGPLWHVASWLAGELLYVEGMRGRTALARVDELPYPELARAAETAAPRLPVGPFEGPFVELQAAALRADATAAARQLAELALALAAAGARDGRYPAALPDHPAATAPDPLTASRPAYRVAADGSARVALDAAEAKAGSQASLASLPFVWELPPPRP